MRRLIGRLLIVSLALSLALGAAWLLFPYWFPKIWRPLLVVEFDPRPVDAIVLLGGESQARPLEAARLFHAGVAPKIVIAGSGDIQTNRRALLKAGVPEDRILIETASQTTFQNAEFSRPVLREAGVQRAVLVTSSFHARRALTTFQQRIPEVDFTVTTSRIGWWDTPSGRLQEDEWAAIEMVKIPGYWVLHGINPWIKSPRAPATKAEPVKP